MSVQVKAHLTRNVDSFAAGKEAATEIQKCFSAADPLKTVMVYTTMNHNQPAVLAGMQSVLGTGVPLVGCTSQGIMSKNKILLEGYALGAMGFGGSSLTAAVSHQKTIQEDTSKKGSNLIAELKAGLGGKEPKAVIVHYDPLCGADTEVLVSAIREQTSALIIGGAASQPWGRVVRTTQLFGKDTLAHSAVAIALAGDFEVYHGLAHGCAPMGIDMTVTKSDGVILLELDGKPALDVWREATGISGDDFSHGDTNPTWGFGIKKEVQSKFMPDGSSTAYVMRFPFGYSAEKKGVICQVHIPVGSKISIFHRSIESVLEGTKTMGDNLKKALAGKNPIAALGFECGARTTPFLGPEETTKENIALQNEVAPSAEWLGMMAWGELCPIGGVDSFHNITYPLLVFAKD